MEINIEWTLQQAVAKHKDGNLQEAERLYRKILRVQPDSLDANHNLGLILVSVNSFEAALPFLKVALEGNPRIEHFWLSYIDALIKDKQFKLAKKVFIQANKKGIAGEKLDALEAKLTPIANDKTQIPFDDEKVYLTIEGPSQQQINNLSGYYQNGQDKDAEKLALFLSEQFPSNVLCWQILAAVQKKTGRLSQAEFSRKKIVAIMPNDPEAHFNLGNTFKELGKFEESEASYERAILLKPDFASAHNNLGVILRELTRLEEAKSSYERAISLNSCHAKAYNNLAVTLRELGRLDDSELNLRRSIALKFNFADAHNNLGITLKELGRPEEAEISYKQALELQPNSAKLYSNLGNVLTELGRYEDAQKNLRQALLLKSDDAETHYNLGNALQGAGSVEAAGACYKQAIVLKPGFSEAILNLSIGHYYMNNQKASISALENLLKMDPDNHGLRAGVLLAIFQFLESNFNLSETYLLQASKIQQKLTLEFRNEKIYRKYLLNLLNWHKNNVVNSCSTFKNKTLFVIGESHCLTYHLLNFQSSQDHFLWKSKLVMGCKQWDLGNSNRNKYKIKFESIFHSLPKFSEVILTIGEIDCRLDSGIIKHKKKFPEKDLKKLVITNIKNYLHYLQKTNADCQHNIIIQGVPCPNIDTKNYQKKEVNQLIEVIKIFNIELKKKSKEKGFGFLDVHRLTDRGDGLSNAIWHIDDIHLSPEAMLEVWSRYTFKKENR